MHDLKVSRGLSSINNFGYLFSNDRLISRKTVQHYFD